MRIAKLHPHPGLRHSGVNLVAGDGWIPMFAERTLQLLSWRPILFHRGAHAEHVSRVVSCLVTRG